MPSCVALGCHRRSSTAILKVFPRKDRRRQIWEERVNRPGWTPTKYSALCEHHFDRDQWELPREDGKRKLKDSAVPTIFVVQDSYDDCVSKDHSYCMPFYRKIYDNHDDTQADNVENDEETMPIEHIKVEVDINENFASETMEEEGEEEEEEKGEEERYVEDIQCTPDISVYPEKGEPFPIEMVDCENDDVNAVLTEPDVDPLAISAEDHMQASTPQPYFGNRQKFVFIPKQTKVMLNVPLKATGDPGVDVHSKAGDPEVDIPSKGNRDLEVNSSEPKGDPVGKPTIKVKSLDGLLDPNVVLKSPINSLSVNSKIMLKSPSAVYLKEKLTLTDAPTTSPVSQLNSSTVSQLNSSTVSQLNSSPISQLNSSPSQQIKPTVQRVIDRVTSPSFSVPPKLKVISNTDSSTPKLNLVSTQIAIHKDLNFVRNTANLIIEKPLVFPPEPNHFTRKLKNSQFVHLNKSRLTRIQQPGSLQSDAQHVLADENVTVTFHLDDEEEEKVIEESRKKTKSVEATKKSNQVKQFFLDHQYSSSKVSRTSAMVRDSKADSVKQIGNNDVKRWLKYNTSSDKDQPANSASHLRTLSHEPQRRNSNPLIGEKSSVVILNPFGHSKSQEVKISDDPPRNINKNVSLQKINGTVTMYDCDECQMSFISSLSLQRHKTRTGHCKAKQQGNHDKGGRKDNDNEDVVVVETSSESSNEYLESEYLDSDDPSVEILSEGDDSEEDGSEELVSFCDDSSSSESNSATDTAGETDGSRTDTAGETDGSRTDTAGETEEIIFLMEKRTEKKNIANRPHQPLKKNVVTKTDLNITSNMKKREFLKTPSKLRQKLANSMRFCFKDKVSDKTSDEKSQRITSSLGNEQRFNFKSVENVSKMEERISARKVKRPRETLTSNTVIVSQKPVVFIPKKDLCKTYLNRNKSPKDVNVEEELVILSDGSVDELSTPSESESSSHQKSTDSLPKVDANKISELIKKKKGVDSKGELSKLNNEHAKYDDSLQLLEKDKTRKPIVLLPKVDPVKDASLNGDTGKITNSTGSVIRDGEESTCKEQDKKNENKACNSNKEEEKVPSVKKSSVDLTNTNECEIKKGYRFQNGTPIVLLPKLQLSEITRKNMVNTRHKRLKVENENNTKNERDGLISGANYESRTLQRVPDKNKTYGKLHCSRGKVKESPSSNQENQASLHPKVKLHGPERRTVVRSDNSQKTEPCSQIVYISSSSDEGHEDSPGLQTNNDRRTRHRLKKLKAGNVFPRKEDSNEIFDLKSKNTDDPVKKLNSKVKEGKSTINENNLEKSPKSPNKKGKQCGDSVQKSQLIKRNILLHRDKTSVCQVCKKKFSDSVLLRRHMKTEHFVYE